MKQRLELTWFNKDKALIPTEQGHYGYMWVNPNDPRYSETHTLIKTGVVTGKQLPKVDEFAYSERADLEPQSDNLLILGESGDVLEALTRVPEFSHKYVGQVKCIYIDPPFNTAQTFANYEDNLEHSVWLTMMRDRLIHLRDLLSEDGSIWVHLDDVENHRMRVVLDEVFGAANFIAEVIWEKKDSPKMDDLGVSVTHDVILVFRKSFAWAPNKFKVDASEKDFPKIDSDGRRYSSRELRKWGQNSLRTDRPNGWYPITAPNGQTVYPIRPDGKEGTWRWGLKLVNENWDRLEWLNMPGPVGLTPYVKTYEDQGKKPLPPTSIWKTEEIGGNPVAKEEIKALFPDQAPFATPKPESLLERIIHISTNPGDLVLDVFGGSGTTAAVAQKMGRKWITCELVEETFKNFTQPRLEKVVSGEDMGGVSKSSGERIDNTTNGLPDGITPEDAQKFTTLLNKIIATDDGLKKDATVKELKHLAKTKKSLDTVNWRGGGGFTVVELSPACFDYNEEIDLVTLTEHATGQTLIDAVAAQLRFYLTPNDRHFHGQAGIQHLVVIEGVLDNEKVDNLMSHLPQGHCLVLAATIIDAETRDHVRSFKNGSRVVSIPHDLFTYSKKQEVK